MEAAAAPFAARGGRWAEIAVRLALATAVLCLVVLIGIRVSGSRALIVRSGSMAPAIGVGDVVVTRLVDPSDVAVHDVVTFRDSSRSGELVTHRVTRVEERSGRFAFVTKGDANTAVERWSIDADGKVGTAGPQTIAASADSYVDGGTLSADSNFGTAAALRVRSSSLGNRRLVVRFSLPAVAPYCAVTRATLRLNASSAATDRSLQVLRAAAAWTESGVTWRNQPGTTGTEATAVSGADWIDFDVSAQVEAMYAGTNNGFVVKDANEGSLLSAPEQIFSSREGANPPQLVLTFG
jgi:signal peptidase I